MKVVGIKPMTRAEIKAYVAARVAKGMRSAGPFAVRMAKQLVGRQAPRRRSRSALCGWVATTRAVRGAPPRRVSGCGQQSIWYNVTKAGTLKLRARRRYMIYLDRGDHKWRDIVLSRYRREILKIAGDHA